MDLPSRRLADTPGWANRAVEIGGRRDDLAKARGDPAETAAGAARPDCGEHPTRGAANVEPQTVDARRPQIGPLVGSPRT
ncbi:MAG: hypothetical protein ACLQAN_00590 [Acidimicrobiales bacterium]